MYPDSRIGQNTTSLSSCEDKNACGQTFTFNNYGFLFTP